MSAHTVLMALLGAFARKDDIEKLHARILARVAELDGGSASERELLSGVTGKPERLRARLAELLRWGVIGCTERGEWWIRNLEALGRDHVPGMIPGQGVLPVEPGLNGALMDGREIFGASLSSSAGDASAEVDRVGGVFGAVQHVAGAGRVSIQLPPAAGSSPPAAGSSPPAAGSEVGGNGRNRSVSGNVPAAAGSPMTCKRHVSSKRHGLSMSWDPTRRFALGDEEVTAAELWQSLMGLNRECKCPGCREEWKSRVMEDAQTVYELVQDARGSAIAKGAGWFNQQYLLGIGVMVLKDGKAVWPQRVGR